MPPLTTSSAPPARTLKRSVLLARKWKITFDGLDGTTRYRLTMAPTKHLAEVWFLNHPEFEDLTVIETTEVFE